MKIRLKQKGFEHYTGQMGAILFKDGVSVRDVLDIDRRRLAGVMYVEDETGNQAPITQDASDAVAPVGRDTVVQKATIERVGGDDSDVPQYTKPVEEKPKKAQVERLETEITVRYSRDELEAIADAKGIGGLREIAEPLGVKGTSIRKLMDGILAIASKAE